MAGRMEADDSSEGLESEDMGVLKEKESVLVYPARSISPCGGPHGSGDIDGCKTLSGI